MIKKTKRNYISLFLPVVALIATSVWYVASPTITEAEKVTEPETIAAVNHVEVSRYITVHLDTNTLLLHDGEKVTILNLVSQGKPGSYYETIGGKYFSDYKEPNHFSSIGHVFMPYSIHIFGNYFIHGIPYYPNGERVSNAYSGGCIRLLDSDAKTVYDFITPTTPIIITRGDENEFDPTATTTANGSSEKMTRLMIATISLEFQQQDDEKIYNLDGVSKTTRKELIPKILHSDDVRLRSLYTKTMGTEKFIDAMNAKAHAIGLTNTTFTDINTPVKTTEEDYTKFIQYIHTYKSYLENLPEGK